MAVQPRQQEQGGTFCLVISAFCALTILPGISPAGTIKGWGIMVFDSNALTDQFTAVAGGGGHSLALKSDGSIVGWGNNFYGQATPPDGDEYVAVAAGGYHSLGLYNICQFTLSGDLNNNCRVNIWDLDFLTDEWLLHYNLTDFAALAANWLVDCHADPDNPACLPK